MTITPLSTTNVTFISHLLNYFYYSILTDRHLTLNSFHICARMIAGLLFGNIGRKDRRFGVFRTFFNDGWGGNFFDCRVFFFKLGVGNLWIVFLFVGGIIDFRFCLEILIFGGNRRVVGCRGNLVRFWWVRCILLGFWGCIGWDHLVYCLIVLMLNFEFLIVNCYKN